MAESMVREIEVGIDGSSGVRCGVIGEIGCSYPLMDVEKRALQAAASAQTKTGEKRNNQVCKISSVGNLYFLDKVLGYIYSYM